MSKIAVFTALAQADPEWDAHEAGWAGHPSVDFFCFCDDVVKLPSHVARKPLFVGSRDPIRRMSESKVAGFSALPGYAHVVWVDPCAQIRPDRIVDLVTEFSKSSALLWQFPHDVEACVYEEANRAFLFPLDRPAIISRQINRYAKEGLPPDFAWGPTHFLVVACEHPQFPEFLSLWQRELRRGSRHDLLALAYVCWRLKLPRKLMRGLWYENSLMSVNQMPDRCHPVAPLSWICLAEWLRRVAHASNLFGHVLYSEAPGRR